MAEVEKTGEVVQYTPPKRQTAPVENAVAIFDTAQFEQMARVANAIAGSSLMPEHIRGANREEALANAFLITEMAFTLGISPTRLASVSYFLHGKLGFEGKLMQSVIERQLHHAFTFEYFEERKDIAIRVTNIHPISGEPVSLEGNALDWQTKEKGGGVKGNWSGPFNRKKQLRYRGVMEWGRAYAPGIVIGLYTEDEMQEMKEDLAERRQRPRIEGNLIPSAPQPGTLAERVAQSGTVQPAEPEPEPDEPVDDWQAVLRDGLAAISAATTKAELGRIEEELAGLDGMPSEIELRLQTAIDERERFLTSAHAQIRREQEERLAASQEPVEEAAVDPDLPPQENHDHSPAGEGAANNQSPATGQAAPVSEPLTEQPTVNKVLVAIRNAPDEAELDAITERMIDPFNWEQVDVDDFKRIYANRRKVLRRNAAAG